MSRSFKEVRISTGLSQEDAARKIGVHPTTLNKYENGARYPSGKVLAKMSQLYGVKLDSLIETETDEGEEEHMNLRLQKMETELLGLYRENKMLKETLEHYEKKAGTRTKAINGD